MTNSSLVYKWLVNFLINGQNVHSFLTPANIYLVLLVTFSSMYMMYIRFWKMWTTVWHPFCRQFTANFMFEVWICQADHPYEKLTIVQWQKISLEETCIIVSGLNKITKFIFRFLSIHTKNIQFWCVGNNRFGFNVETINLVTLEISDLDLALHRKSIRYV